MKEACSPSSTVMSSTYSSGLAAGVVVLDGGSGAVVAFGGSGDVGDLQLEGLVGLVPVVFSGPHLDRGAVFSLGDLDVVAGRGVVVLAGDCGAVFGVEVEVDVAGCLVGQADLEGGLLALVDGGVVDVQLGLGRGVVVLDRRLPAEVTSGGAVEVGHLQVEGLVGLVRVVLARHHLDGGAARSLGDLVVVVAGGVVVLARDCCAVLGLVVEGDVTRRAGGELHREVGGVALVDPLVLDRESRLRGRCRVVVLDGGLAGEVARGHPVEVGDVEVERLVRLVGGVLARGHLDGGAARSLGDLVVVGARSVVVGAGRRGTVRRRVVEGDVLRCRRRQPHLEVGSVALVDVEVIDVQLRLGRR